MKILKCEFCSKKKPYIINLLIILFLFFVSIANKNKNNEEFLITNHLKVKDYTHSKFAIIQRNCEACGLFSFYIISLGCIHKYLLNGFIPIIDIKSFPNVINGFDTLKANHWEFFFEQPFGYTLEEVLKNAKNIINITCIDCNECSPTPDSKTMFYNLPKLNFWHNFASKYISIKKELIILSKKISYNLFENSKNILGVLTRGTDYISRKPKQHPIPPDTSDLILEVKKMDNKYSYDYIFFSTEDENIRKQFEKNFIGKIRQLKPKTRINYDYNKKDYLNYNKDIRGNIEFNKIYLLNIIILSKCLDIISARCSGAIGIFVFSDGFRNVKIYDLGEY